MPCFFLDNFWECHKASCCNMKGPVCWGFCPAQFPTVCKPQIKSITQEISISYKADWPIRSGFLLILVTYLNTLFWSKYFSHVAEYLFQLANHILLLRWSWQEWGESTSSSPEFSCSPCIISTSCLVFPPSPLAWPISIYLKHDWQNTDNSPAPGC